MVYNLFYLFWGSKLAWKMVHFWNFQFFQKESAFYDFFWTPCVYFFKQSPLSDPRLDWEKRTRPNWILYGVRRVVRLQTFLGKTPGNFQWEVIPGGSSPYMNSANLYYQTKFNIQLLYLIYQPNKTWFRNKPTNEHQLLPCDIETIL